MDSKKMLAKIKKEICDIYPTAKIILYGSRARGDFDKYSDWDFLILIEEKISENQKIEIIERLFELELKFDQIFSPIIHNISEWQNLDITPFFQNVQREGIAI